jgi:hypothetical protein
MYEMNKNRLLLCLTPLIVLFAIIFPNDVYANTQELQAQPSGILPEVIILSTSDNAIELQLIFPENPLGVYENGMVFDENVYSHPSDTGTPDLPILRKEIEIPSGTEFTIEILNKQSYSIALGENGLPGSIPNRTAEVAKCDSEGDCYDEGGDEGLDVISNEGMDGDIDEDQNEDPDEGVDEVEDETEDEVVNEENNLYPSTPAELMNTYVVRGHQVAQLQFWPVQLNAEENTVEIYQEVVIRINILDAGVNIASTNSAVQSSAAFDEILSDEIINYSNVVGLENDRGGAAEGEKVLIISPDGFLSTLSSLVVLKESQGFSVTLVGLSSIGSSTNQIKNYIKNAYDSWNNPPTYVILVGDVDNGSLTMPAFTGQSSGSVTDLYYGTVDGADWIPDIFVGRLPARSTGQLTTMINNLVAYDQLTGTENWVKKAALLASSDSNYYYIAEGTQNYVINAHTASAGYTGNYPSTQAGGDKLYAVTYSAGNANVINAINSKRSLITYSGHGSRFSWGGPAYGQSDIRNISNSGVFSVVTSFACVTGDFSTTESFGETWLLQSNKGAVAFIGSSASSYWGPDDVLERGMMDALYSGQEGANIVGYFRYAGLMEVEAQRPGTGTAQSRYYWESYNLFGDPSLEMLIGPKPVAAYQPALSSSTIDVRQAPGQEAVIHLTLTNAGANIDNYSIELTPGEWTSNVRTNSVIELAPGESTTLEIVVTVPEDAPFGQIEEYILNVISLNDPDNPPANDSTTIELMASVVSYIPLINN